MISPQARRTDMPPPTRSRRCAWPPPGGGYGRPAQPTPSRHGSRPVADGARHPPLHSIAGATARARPTLATSAAPSNPCPSGTILPSDQWPCLSFWLFMPARTCRCLAQNFDRYLKLIVHSLSFSFLSAARSRVLPLTINTSVQILRHGLIFSTAFDGRRRGQTPNLQGRIIRFNGVETGTREKFFLTSAPRKRARQGPRAECAAALNFGRHLGRPPLPLGNPGSAKPGPQAGITLMR